MSFLLVVSWMHHCYDDVDDLFFESIRLYEDVPTQTTMFITGQDPYREIGETERCSGTRQKQHPSSSATGES